MRRRIPFPQRRNQFASQPRSRMHRQINRNQFRRARRLGIQLLPRQIKAIHRMPPPPQPSRRRSQPKRLPPQLIRRNQNYLHRRTQYNLGGRTFRSDIKRHHPLSFRTQRPGFFLRPSFGRRVAERGTCFYFSPLRSGGLQLGARQGMVSTVPKSQNKYRLQPLREPAHQLRLRRSEPPDTSTVNYAYHLDSRLAAITSTFAIIPPRDRASLGNDAARPPTNKISLPIIKFMFCSY